MKKCTLYRCIKHRLKIYLNSRLKNVISYDIILKTKLILCR